MKRLSLSGGVLHLVQHAFFVLQGRKADRRRQWKLDNAHHSASCHLHAKHTMVPSILLLAQTIAAAEDWGRRRVVDGRRQARAFEIDGASSPALQAIPLGLLFLPILERVKGSMGCRGGSWRKQGIGWAATLPDLTSSVPAIATARSLNSLSVGMAAPGWWANKGARCEGWLAGIPGVFAKSSHSDRKSVCELNISSLGGGCCELSSMLPESATSGTACTGPRLQLCKEASILRH